MQIRLSIKQGYKMLNLISQTKLITKLQNCKHYIATLLCNLCLFVPNNISAVCSSDVDINNHVMINIDAVEFHDRIKMYSQKNFEIAGVRYVSTKVSDGVFAGRQSRTCTSTNGNAYYLVSKNNRLTSCPDGSSIVTIGSTSATPTPAQVSSVIGNEIASIGGGCLSNRFYMMTDDTDMHYTWFSGSAPSGGWSTISWSSGSWEGTPLCKLDFQ